MLEKAIKNKPSGFEDCIVWARQLFQEYFYNQISQLLFNFPPDQVSKELLTQSHDSHSESLGSFHIYFNNFRTFKIQKFPKQEKLSV